MKNAVFLLMNLMFFNFGFLQNSFGKFILVEVDQKENAMARSGAGNIYWNRDIYFEKYVPVNLLLIYFCNCRFKLGLRETESCLKEEGIPDVCLSAFKTGEGWEGCNRWLETNHAAVNRSQARLEKCMPEKPTTPYHLKPNDL